MPADLHAFRPLKAVAPRWSVAAEPSVLQPSSLSRYLDCVRHGLLLLDRAGRVIVCTAPARSLFERIGSAFEGPASARQLLRALLGGQLSRREIFRQLRGAREQRAPTLFEVVLSDHTIQVELAHVPGEGWAVTLEDVSTRKATEARADEMARLDPLTGLPNRLMLRERLAEAVARLERTGEAFTVLLVDLDRFKPVNDTLGHPIGDALLEKVADRLRSTVRPTDTVARIGGDEFVILQTGVREAADTQALARRVVDLIGRTYMVEGHLLTIGASVGVALAPGDGIDADKLLKNADLALYRAKLDGRGTYSTLR